MARIGVFYSIGFFLVMLVFLAFTLVIIKQFSSSTEIFSEDASLERIHNLDESIQKAFRDILSSTSGIELRTIGNDVVFIENLPNTKSVDFKNNISKFKAFIESNFSIYFNVTDINESLSLFVKPHGIIYTHNNYGGNIIKVSPNQNNFNGYKVIITTSSILGSCAFSGSSSNPYFNFEASGSSGTCLQNSIAQVELFDPVPTSLGTVTLTGNQLTITSSSNLNVNLRIEELKQTNETIIVTTHGNTLNFNYVEYSFIKNGTIRIL